MLSVADIPMAGIHFTGIIGAILWMGKEYRIATYLGARVVKIQNMFFVKYFSLKKASKFPVFVKGFSLLLAGIDYASRRMRACSIR